MKCCTEREGERKRENDLMPHKNTINYLTFLKYFFLFHSIEIENFSITQAINFIQAF